MKFFIGHGTSDPLIPAPLASKTEEIVRQKGDAWSYFVFPYLLELCLWLHDQRPFIGQAEEAPDEFWELFRSNQATYCLMSKDSSVEAIPSNLQLRILVAIPQT